MTNGATRSDLEVHRPIPPRRELDARPRRALGKRGGPTIPSAARTRDGSHGDERPDGGQVRSAVAAAGAAMKHALGSVRATSVLPELLLGAALALSGCVHDSMVDDAAHRDAASLDGGPDPGARDAGARDAAAAADASRTDAGDEPASPLDLARLCRAPTADPACAPPGRRCEPRTPLYAYAWAWPRHWEPSSGSSGLLVAAEEVSLHQGGNPACNWLDDNAGCSPSRTIARNLTELAERLRARPEGRRAIVWRAFGNETLLQEHPDDATVPGPSGQAAQPGIWWESGATATSEVTRAVFEGLAARGVTLDWLFIDVEWDLSNWSIGTCSGADPRVRAEQESRWRAVEEDPRFPAILAPWREVAGTDVGGALAAELCPWVPGTERYLSWNALMHDRTAAHYETAFFEPARAVFPSVRVSNYAYAHHDRRFRVPDLNGHAVMRYGDGALVGTHQSPPCYGELGQVADRPNAEISSTETYGRTAFNSFRFAINTYRASALARPDVPMAPWVGPRDYADGGRVPLARTDLWDELVLHLGVSGPDALIYWNNAGFVSREGDEAFERALEELDRTVGCPSRRPLQTTLADWLGPWVVSGVEVAGRRVWRFTAEDPATTLNLEGDDWVARVEGRTLRFPSAWLLEPEPGFARGVWVIQSSEAPMPSER